MFKIPRLDLKLPMLDSDAVIPRPSRPLIDSISPVWVFMAVRHLFFWGAALVFASGAAAWITGARDENGRIEMPPVSSALILAVVLGAAYWPLKFQLWPWWGQLLASAGFLAAGFGAFLMAERRAEKD